MPSCTARFDVLGADVVLEIDERLGAAVAAGGRRAAHAARRRGERAAHGVDPRARRGKAGRGRRRAPRRVAFRERARKVEGRVAGAGRALALRRCARA